jgi:hypothetical protein
MQQSFQRFRQESEVESLTALAICVSPALLIVQDRRRTDL